MIKQEYWVKVKELEDKDDSFVYDSAGFKLSDYFGIESDDEIIDDYNILYEQRVKIFNEMRDNNGWVKIESDDDLPTKSGRYFGFKDGKISFVYYIENTLSNVRKEEFKEDCTHWKLIRRPLGPKY